MDKSVAKILKQAKTEMARLSEAEIEARSHEPGIAMVEATRYATSERKGISNYDRTYIAATLSPSGLELWHNAVEHFKRLAPASQTFKVHSAERVDTIFQFLVPDCRVDLGELDVDTPRNWADHLEFRHSLPPSAVRDVIARAVVPSFRAGKPIYNIHPGVMMGVSEYESHTGDRLAKATRERLGNIRAKSYLTWIQQAVERSLRGLRMEAHRRIRSQVRSLVISEAFLEARKKAILTQCCTDVGEVMRRYSGLGDDVLRSAIREFLVSDSMEW